MEIGNVMLLLLKKIKRYVHLHNKHQSFTPSPPSSNVEIVFLPFSNGIFSISKIHKAMCDAKPAHIMCIECNNTKTRIDVDHFPLRFCEIRNDYIKSKPIGWITSVGWNDLRDTFSDPAEKDEWITYHDRRAQLRYLCHECNVGHKA